MRFITTCFALMMSASSLAATLNIEFINEDKYLDIDSGREMQSRFTERLKNKLGESFTKIAEKLPEDNVLNVSITQIDLAGDTRFSSGDMYDIRIMKDLYRPLLAFDVKLTQGEETLHETSARLVDNNYLNNSFMNGNEQFGYEMAMIKRWGSAWLKTH